MIDRGKACLHCGSLQHSSFQCFSKPRKPMQSRSTLKATKPMKRIGKIQKKTNAATAAWKKTVKPNHQGYWQCHYCLAWTKDPVVEHKDSKVRRPDRRTDWTNYVISCTTCNGLKNSKSHDEFCKMCVISQTDVLQT